MRAVPLFSLALLSLLGWPSLDAAAQPPPMSDDELFANAIAAAPEAVGRNATVVAVDEGGQCGR
jgi:hypothetical protein